MKKFGLLLLVFNFFVLMLFSAANLQCVETNYIPGESNIPIVELTKAGNNVIMSQGFTLKKDKHIKIYGIGEGFFDDMFDYGWIINADTRRKIWEMEIEQTNHAGGAKKNRKVVKEIFLKKGNYAAYYKTDDSHSYNRWNEDPPDDEAGWGLIIYTPGEADSKDVILFDERRYRSKNLVAEITGVNDNNFESREFELKKETKIRIYAIGEGSRTQMFDYGWIEDESGMLMWQMDYKNSMYAGGATKNRVAVEVISLPPGRYKIYYKTDESHSYNNWNANPPEDQVKYGITLLGEAPQDRQEGN